MARVAVDTNGYVELLRGGAAAVAIRAAMAEARGGLYVLTPVIMELLQGARTPAEGRTIRQRFLDAVPPSRRIAATPAQWAATGELVATMARAGHDRAELTRRAFWVDLHVATLCRMLGITLLTNDADHARIAPYARHATWPLPDGA